MPINRLFIPAVAVLGLVAIGLSASANAAAPTVLGAGHDQISAKGKSTFTLIFRGGYRGGAVGFRGYRGGFGRTYAFAGRRGLWGIWREARLLGWRTLLAWCGLAPRRLVWWLASSLVRRMGLAPRWLVWWLGLAARRRSLWLWIRRWKLLLELPRRWLWAYLLPRLWLAAVVKSWNQMTPDALSAGVLC